MRLRTSLPPVILATAFLVALSGCSTSPSGGNSSSPAAGAPINVWMTDSTSGAIATSAALHVDGMKAAVASINASGGILGRQVNLTVVDDQLNPSVATNLLQQQLDKGKPDLVYHGGSSTVTLSILPTLTRQKIISEGCTQAASIGDPTLYPYAFGLTTATSLESAAMTARLEKDNITKVGLLSATDANGQSVQAGYLAAFKAAQIEASTETYAPTDLDMTAQLQRLANNKPEAIIVQGYGAPVGYILKSKSKLDLSIPFYGTSSIANGNNLGKISQPSDWKDLLLLATPVMSPDNPTLKGKAYADMSARLKKAGVTIDDTAFSPACGWDALQTYKQAVEQAKSTDPDKVKKALENLKEPAVADRKQLIYPLVGYSAASHFVQLPLAQAYYFVKPGPLDDRGIIEPAN